MMSCLGVGDVGVRESVLVRVRLSDVWVWLVMVNWALRVSRIGSV